MTQLRRTIALLLIFLAAPSVFWIVTVPLFPREYPDWVFGLVRELFFVACLGAAALTAWRGSRYWEFILLAALGIQTYVVAGSFIKDVMLVPDHWTYFGNVAREAAHRGFNGGPGLIWSLIMLPLGLPALLLLAVSLCIMSQPFRRKG
jgi:hypothetical protein